VKMGENEEISESSQDSLLPVSLLCGFLGAGKTTLLKHILETKHAEEDFKCAVIVNDMAALNIDKSLIDQSSLVQSDKVIAMQNGCFCCTLANDLVDQIIELAGKNMFNYMLIEASGVSEPSQIAPLFDLCDDEHNHDEVHKDGPQLGEVARLDTCVTVIDAAEFYKNLESMDEISEDNQGGSIAELMMEQVEFSNVVVLNKTDLVTEAQQQDILERISILNPKVEVLKSLQCQINVMEILNTHLYSREDMRGNSVFVSASKVKSADKTESEELGLACCEESIEKDGEKCCNRQEFQTKFSQIILGVVSNNREMTRHEERFGITSFIYRSRRPFHPCRLYDNVLEPLFIFQGADEKMNEINKSFESLQQELGFGLKQDQRRAQFGELMRSKGFIWIATSQFFRGAWQQAGNILRIKPDRPWLCEMRQVWEGTDSEQEVRKELVQENGEEWLYGDRSQELVFIGKNLNHEEIQRMLDDCLLQDDEMEMGPIIWQENWLSEDKIQLPTILLPATIIDSYPLESPGSLDLDKNLMLDYEEDEVEAIQITTIKPQRATEFVYDPR